MRIECKGMLLGLDSPGGEFSFLSHAHSDHTGGMRRQKRIIASPETLDLAGLEQSRLAEPETGNWKLLDAGHMLGARQLALESDGERVVYTGDFCIKPNVFGMKAQIPQCDRLIMEATYGDPSYVFPPHGDVHARIGRWVKDNSSRNLIIGSYELGKTQELVRILNECGSAPIVTQKAESFCSIYEKYGLKLDRLAVGSEEAEEAMARPFVAIVPMGKAKRYFARRLSEAFERETLCAVATGWALHYRFNTDASFPLSDHADFNDLVEYVSQTGAKKVEFFCGDGSRVLDAARNGAVLNS